MRLDEVVQGFRAILRDIDAGTLARDLQPFALCSLAFGTELIARLDDGRFHDPAWVRTLAIDADARYLRAVRDPSARPGPWRVAFDVAARGKHRAMRNLLLGINAHILYDLPVTLSQYASAAQSAEQRADFSRLNDIIRTAVDGVQESLEVSTRWLYYGDLAAGRIDEVAVWGTFQAARAAAFDLGARLRDGSISLTTIERASTASAHAIALLPL